MRNDLWTLKTFAFLHDPPHKPLVLGRDHARIGKDLAGSLCGGGVQITPEEEAAIQQADRLASGADREEFLRNLAIDPRRELTFIHPLDAATLARKKNGHVEFAEVALSPEDVEQARAVVEGPDFISALASVPDSRLRYLLLWRFCTDLLREVEGRGGGRFGALWDVLPADTRMPNHPALVHNSLVACLAPTLAEGQDAALLRFSVGPVQSFLEAARSLADLWAGSDLMSEAVFEAMRPVIEAHGPDCVLYPHLRWQPLFDQWLCRQVGDFDLEKTLATVVENAGGRSMQRGLRIPSLPNVFVAVVPHDKAQALAADGQKAIQDFLDDALDRTLENAQLDGDDDTVRQRARTQVLELLEVHWSVVPWSLRADAGEFLKGPRAWPEEVVQAVQKAMEKTSEPPGYRPNAGGLYPVVSEQSAVLLDAAKRERLSPCGGRKEDGLKCTMCGEREVLGENGFHAQRSAWREWARDRARFPWLRENEAFCGVCLLKRIRGRMGPGGHWRHPSTTEVATSRLKLEIVRRCHEDDALKEQVRGLLAACERLPGDRDEWRVFCVPALLEEAGDDDLLKEFARLDGQVLLPISRRDIEDDEAREALHRARRDLQKALEHHPDIPAPSGYVAVTVFDGDEIGKWLSGAKAPSLERMLHPRALEQLGEWKNRIQGLARPVTPAIHATISAICSGFAQVAAPWTLEREGLPGHLVYAGGDDALFLAPPWDALRLVWRLRLRFSGYPRSIGQAEDPPAPERGEVRPWFTTRVDRRVVLAFGGEATASAGLCIFHAKDPLGLALERAREVERQAKESGRNAVGIAVLRRSGQESRAVLPFGETMTDFLALVGWFAKARVSRSLGVLLKAEFAAIRESKGASPRDLLELASPLVRRLVARRLVEDKDPEASSKELLDRLIRVGHGLVGRARDGRFLDEWADLVSIAEFAARPHDQRGEEER